MFCLCLGLININSERHAQQEESFVIRKLTGKQNEPGKQPCLRLLPRAPADHSPPAPGSRQLQATKGFAWRRKMRDEGRVKISRLAHLLRIDYTSFCQRAGCRAQPCKNRGGGKQCSSARDRPVSRDTILSLFNYILQKTVVDGVREKQKCALLI